jgi:hypothetical protein
MLSDLEYLYPYHQAVGFLLQRAGYKSEEIALLRKPGMEHDFFLAHGMTNPLFDREWRIYYPAGVQANES